MLEHSPVVLQYKLPEFEGPLDLLLTLISKNKINICDIQISELLEQYMEQISKMQEQDMDIASEFLEMAQDLSISSLFSCFQSTRKRLRSLKKSLRVSL